MQKTSEKGSLTYGLWRKAMNATTKMRVAVYIGRILFTLE